MTTFFTADNNASRRYVGDYRIFETDADVVVVAGDVAGRLSSVGRT